MFYVSFLLKTVATILIFKRKPTIRAHQAVTRGLNYRGGHATHDTSNRYSINPGLLINPCPVITKDNEGRLTI